ncbi:MAG: hypothetical protein HYY06_11580 [Deltaproteobacteria bacterium]|nr:hypothetical protein [Deltaproteobacteria bacterium]
MSNGIRQAEVVRALRRWEADVDDLQDDPRLAGMGIGRADLDRDGRIAGDEELGALARRMDEADGGFDGRIDIADDDGDATGAPVVEAISEAAERSVSASWRSHARECRGWTRFGATQDTLPRTRRHDITCTSGTFRRALLAGTETASIGRRSRAGHAGSSSACGAGGTASMDLNDP